MTDPSFSEPVSAVTFDIISTRLITFAIKCSSGCYAEPAADLRGAERGFGVSLNVFVPGVLIYQARAD